jgi:acyl-coenzyme A synthetase/AMP-(fatty) acid ligase
MNINLENNIGYLTKKGEIVLTGRNDERINLNGVKVNPSKIDRIMESYPEIKEAACFSITKSDGRTFLGAAFVSNQEEFNLKKFVDYLLVHPEKHEAPKVFIKVGKIPRNNNNKIARHELSKKYSISENNELLST